MLFIRLSNSRSEYHSAKAEYHCEAISLVSVLVVLAELLIVKNELLIAMRAYYDGILVVELVGVDLEGLVAVGAFSLKKLLATVAVAIVTVTVTVAVAVVAIAIAIVAITIAVIHLVNEIIFNVAKAFVDLFNIVVKSLKLFRHIANNVDESGNYLALFGALINGKSLCKTFNISCFF